jgi:hypothetical protein
MRKRLLWMLVLVAACRAEVDPERAALAARVESLEQAVRRLAAPPIREQTPRPFSMLCPGGWRELGAVGAARWLCRSTQPDRDGGWPQCSVIALPYDGAQQPREYFELAANLTPQLRATTGYEEAPIVVEQHPGFRSSYERTAASRPQKSLASLFVEGDFTFVATCTVSAADFADLQPTFQRVVESLRFGKAKVD